MGGRGLDHLSAACDLLANAQRSSAAETYSARSQQV
jgi:hypothetical protein